MAGTHKNSTTAEHERGLRNESIETTTGDRGGKHTG
jgi:hypothetical protein